ncbi:hypothetical protein C8A03DRAFT_44438 [Achaetomium macrosporum]|uniref:MYND-type domain-containing protein n=1 Tax=Achaetomium macrosporum TaxID=79813 RepID=A0AAN7CA02_9PEZI|nr:hypothetical protein C8A03DRAFT_44438 [Achaetomium macrosporum]
MATPQFICANWNPESTDCEKSGRYSCKNCLLVLYCGPNCHKAHWPVHKVDCNSLLAKQTWKPDWVLENRTPAFVGGGPGVQFGGKKYLFGNVPALDVLQLGSNEGGNYGGPLRLLFAASGDLRNAVKTIAQLPNSYSGSVEVTMNDRDLDVVARNVIALLIALVVDNIEEAVDCIIHVWYSALIRKSDLDILQQRIHPLIKSVCEKTKGKPPSSLLAKSSWDRLLSFTDVPAGLTVERAQRIRTAVTLAESRKDYRDRHLLFQSSSHRIAKKRFWEDGLLLPFGSRRNDFQGPNPTFFQDTDAWPMYDNADPLNGWSLQEVRDYPSGPATADIYGKLFYYLRAVLRAFAVRLSSLQVAFRLFQMDASDLATDHLESGSFDRIEVSNISDGGYLGIHRTLAVMVPLLQSPLANPHATLITLFMNAVDENMTDADRIADMARHSPATKRLLKYLPLKGMPNSQSDPELIKFIFARDSVATHDHIFDRVVKNFKFAEAAQFLGAAMKEKHTIIEKWRFRLKLRPGQPGAQEEFDRLLAGGVSGKERYVEWKRIAIYEDEVNGKGTAT